MPRSDGGLVCPRSDYIDNLRRDRRLSGFLKGGREIAEYPNLNLLERVTPYREQHWRDIFRVFAKIGIRPRRLVNSHWMAG